MTRPECHLCEQMAAALARVQSARAFEFELTDIADDPVLMQRYGGRVPVLVWRDHEICSGKLDRNALEAFLNHHGSALE